MAIALNTLAYAKRRQEAGISAQHAEAQAEALAAAMTDSLATKQDLRELEARIDARFSEIDGRFAGMNARFEYPEKHIDTRLAEQEKRLEIRLVEQERRVEIRFAEQTARFDATLANLERRMTMRLGAVTVTGVGVVATLVKLL